MTFKPGTLTARAPRGPRCPWCMTECVVGEQDTTRHFGVLFHRGCYEDLLRSGSEIDEVREATK